MGTASYVMAGRAGSGAFHSSCHGAGRVMSRHAARKRIRGQQLRRELEGRGIAVTEWAQLHSSSVSHPSAPTLPSPQPGKGAGMVTPPMKLFVNNSSAS